MTGKDVLKGKTRRTERPGPEGPGRKDAIGKAAKDKGGLENSQGAAEGQGPDRAREARTIGKGIGRQTDQGDKLGPRTGCGKDKLQDRLTKDKSAARTSSAKDKSPRTSSPRTSWEGQAREGQARRQGQAGARTSSERTRLGKDKRGKDELRRTRRQGQGGEPRSPRARPCPTSAPRPGSPRPKPGRARQDPRRPPPRDHVARVRLPPRRSPARPASPPCRPPARHVSSRPKWCSTSARTCRGRRSKRSGRHGLTVVGAQASAITGGTLYHFRCRRAAGRRRRALHGSGAHRHRLAELRVPHHPGHRVGNASSAGRIARAIHRRETAARRGPQGRDRPRDPGGGDRLQGRHQSSRSRRRDRRGIRRRRTAGAGAFARHRHGRRDRVAPQAPRHRAERENPGGACVLDHDAGRRRRRPRGRSSPASNGRSTRARASSI